MSRTYWRSGRQLEGDPEFLAIEQREFPEGASEPPDGVTRREMVTLIGATLSLAGLASCRRPEQTIVPFVDPPESVIPGIPRHYATTMPFGRQAWGLVVESHEGRPTKIEGNTLHRSTGGASNVRTQSAILDLYDPDRSQAVLHAGRPASWTDFAGAWTVLEKAHLAAGGAGLAMLSRSFASPTLARLRAAFQARFPKATWAVWEPSSDENVLAGVAHAAGRPLETVIDVGRARIIAALDADLFGAHPQSIRNMTGFAEGRRAGASGGAMNRLYSVEALHTLTGAMADHRLRLRSSHVGAFLVALARATGAVPDLPAAGTDAAWLDAPARAFIDALAADLRDNRGAGLVVAGERQPPEVHAAVAALNAALGNGGVTVSYHEPLDAALPSRASLAALCAAMSGGAVTTLVILDGNPVYDAPADLDFTAALAKVANVVTLADRVDETSRLAAWHLPRAHFLESWGDTRALDGPASVVQPLILPLYGGRSEAEVLAHLATGREASGYDLVRETWTGILGAPGFESKWGRVLHDGVLAGSEPRPLDIAPAARPLADLAAATPPAPAGNGAYEIVFMASPAVHDGRFANNGWLQELPDTIGKIVWDNPALLSPAAAAALGVRDEDVVRIESGGRAVEAPVHVLPGLEDGTVALTLGYGRTAAGRIGDGVGVDVYRLRSSAAPDLAPGATMARTGARRPLATTQEHGSMEGRPIVLETTVDEYRRDPAALHEGGHAFEPTPLFDEKKYEHGPQWGMTIDLNSCVGCNACVVACQSENNIPVVGKDQVRRGRQMHWLRIDRYFAGEPGDPSPEVVVQPIPCMHCENAPCEQVCPVAATVHDEQGLNVMVYNRCIGTRYCSNNCPYKVRRFNFYNFTKDTPESLKLAHNPDVTVRARGVMEKCTYCTQRINAARIDARLAGRAPADGDVVTACQQACPTQAITFGDLFDAGSRVARSAKDPRNYALLEELHSRPRTTYLAKLRNPHPALAAAAPAGEGHGGAAAPDAHEKGAHT
jgi:molybdopterin-containing oxidoreductase family iron-sulfur binding subunit